MNDPLWNSLEVVKVITGLVTPILVLILGIVINNSIKDAERSTALRSEIYKSIGGELNDIYSYLAFVGSWKELTPIQILAKKRAIDKAMYTYRPFFSDELFATYERFMQQAFAVYGEPGKDARIRSDIKTADGDRSIHSVEWNAEWQDRFSKERNKFEQMRAYHDFLEQLARDLHI